MGIGTKNRTEPEPGTGLGFLKLKGRNPLHSSQFPSHFNRINLCPSLVLCPTLIPNAARPAPLPVVARPAAPLVIARPTAPLVAAPFVILLVAARPAASHRSSLCWSLLIPPLRWSPLISPLDTARLVPLLVATRLVLQLVATRPATGRRSPRPSASCHSSRPSAGRYSARPAAGRRLPRPSAGHRSSRHWSLLVSPLDVARPPTTPLKTMPRPCLPRCCSHRPYQFGICDKIGYPDHVWCILYLNGFASLGCERLGLVGIDNGPG